MGAIVTSKARHVFYFRRRTHRGQRHCRARQPLNLFLSKRTHCCVAFFSFSLRLFVFIQFSWCFFFLVACMQDLRIDSHTVRPVNVIANKNNGCCILFRPEASDSLYQRLPRGRQHVLHHHGSAVNRAARDWQRKSSRPCAYSFAYCWRLLSVRRAQPDVTSIDVIWRTTCG